MTRAGAALLAFGAAVVVGTEFVVIGLAPVMATRLALSPAEIGLLVTLFAAASALLGPVLVAAASRIRPSVVLAAALAPFVANLLLLAFPSFAMAAGLRVLQGAALPLFMSVAGAQLAAVRGVGPGIALLYAGVTVGGTLAPPLSAFAAERLGWAAPMAALGAFALVVGAGCLLLQRQAPVDRGGAAWRLLARPSMRAHLVLSILIFATMFTGFSYIALLLGRSGLDANAIILALLGFGGAGIVGNWLAGRLSRWNLLGTGAVALAVVAATTWLCFAKHPGALAIGLAVLAWGLAHAAGFVFCQIRVMAAAPASPSFAGSLNISAANIGIALGSFAGGQALGLGGPSALAITTAILAVISIVAAIWIGRDLSETTGAKS